MKKIILLIIATYLSPIANSTVNACDFQTNREYVIENSMLAAKVMSESFALYYIFCKDVLLLDEVVTFDLSGFDSNIGSFSFNIMYLTKFYDWGGDFYQKESYILTNEARSEVFFEDLRGFNAWMKANNVQLGDDVSYPGTFRGFPVDRLVNGENIFIDWSYECDLPDALCNLEKRNNKIDLKLMRNYKTNEIILIGDSVEKIN